MPTRYVVALVIAGLAGAAAVHHWPDHAVASEMAVYSIMTPGLLFLGLWSDRSRRRFWAAASSVALLHFLFLFFIRACFPFSTIRAVVPIAIVEFIVLAVLMLKILGY